VLHSGERVLNKAAIRIRACSAGIYNAGGIPAMDQRFIQKVVWEYWMYNAQPVV